MKKKPRVEIANLKQTDLYATLYMYSSVPNRRAVRNKRAGGKIVSKSINVLTKIRPCRGNFFLKINKHADQNKAVHIGWNKCVGGNFFSKPINMQTKIRLCREKFFLKHVHASLLVLNKLSD